MNEPMNPDDFETRLQGQPMRQVPAEWRAEILSTAREAAGSVNPQHAGRVSTSFSILRAQLVSLFWPSPKAWAGLAIVWLVLAGANRIALKSSEDLVHSGVRPSAATIAAWKEQERILAELIQPGGTAKAEAVSPARPRPRSELTGRLRMG